MVLDSAPNPRLHRPAGSAVRTVKRHSVMRRAGGEEVLKRQSLSL